SSGRCPGRGGPLPRPVRSEHRCAGAGPSMKLKRAFVYFLREAAADLWKRRTSNLVSIATIAATLYVLGLLLCLMTSLAHLVTSWAEENRVSVYLADGVSQGDLARVQGVIRKNPAVESSDFVSKDEALGRFRKDFPDLADLAVGLDPNPLPASFEV